MFQIDTDTTVNVMPAPSAVGTPGWFTGGNPGPGTPVPATNFSPDWCNIVQGELLNVLAAAGIAGDKTKLDQVATSIKALIQGSAGTYYADTGAANALVITPAPAITAYAGGQRFLVVPANVNTGASTINVNALGVKTIVHPDGSALNSGDIPAAGLIEVIYQATLGKFVLMAAVSAVPTFGEITATGAGNIAIPAGARLCVIEFCGAGGGGGTGDGGAGGPSGTSAGGGNGGNTTVNGVVAVGGTGGIGGAAAGNTYGGDGGVGGAGAGSSYKGQGGMPGLFSPTAGTPGNIGGTGGCSHFGGGGWYNNAGAQPAGYGGGGAGGKTGNSGSFSGGGGGAAETRRIVLSAATLAGLGGNIGYNNGVGGAGGHAVGNFDGSAGGNGYIRYEFKF